MTIAALVASGPLRMGATGPAVTALQLALRNDGRDIVADGDFGRITLTALMAFEAAHGLKPDAWSTSRRRRLWTRSLRRQARLGFPRCAH